MSYCGRKKHKNFKQCLLINMPIVANRQSILFLKWIWSNADLYTSVTEFHKFIIKHRKKLEFTLDQIGNMDETPIFFDMPDNRTLKFYFTKCVFVRTTRHEKMYFTVVLCCMANGSELSLMVIFKRKLSMK